MKIVGRIVIILAVALVVVGGAAAFSKSDWAARFVPGFVVGRGSELGDGRFPDKERLPQFNLRGDHTGDFADGFPEGLNRNEFRHGGERAGSFGIFGFMGVVRNLLTIGIIVLLVVAVDRLFVSRKAKIKAAE